MSIKSTIAAVAASPFLFAGAAFAGPYVNIESNIGYPDGEYSSATTDLHIGYEGSLSDNADFYAQVNFWYQNGASVDIRDYMNYDPYVGRTSANSSLPQDDQTWRPGHWDQAPEPVEEDLLEGEENQFTPGLPA